jgi:hypothetical protein
MLMPQVCAQSQKGEYNKREKMFKARERPIRKAKTKKKSLQQFQKSFFHQDY